MPLSLKVVFIGDSKVGKTAVMRRLLGEYFDPVFIMTTSGEAIKRKQLVVNNYNVELELWDAPGHEGFRTDAAVYMKNVKVAVLFFDVTNHTSFENIDNWLNFVPPAESPVQKTPTFIIGNKIDKASRTVKKEEAEHKARKSNSYYFETSAKDNNTEDFNQILKQMIEIVLDNSPGLTNSGTVPVNQALVDPWYKPCVLL